MRTTLKFLYIIVITCSMISIEGDIAILWGLAKELECITVYEW